MIGERDKKLMQLMDQFAEKDEELEDLRKNDEQMKSQIQQLESDVSISERVLVLNLVRNSPLNPLTPRSKL